jgi:mono/diheme cytochrome c family protein
MVERCITCHVPDIQKIGPQEAAQRLGPNHPPLINDSVFAKYGQDTLICQPPSAAPSASPSASASASASASPKPAASPGASASPSPSALPAATPTASCLDPKATPYYVRDANNKIVTDPTTNKPVVAQLTGFIPNAYKGLGIDESGCIICHNGNRQATDQAGAHQNLVANPFGVFATAPKLYENNCAQCHGVTGEGGKGPPLNDQNRLGFFNDDYYYRCIYLGNTGEEHKGTIMPPWGANKLLPQPINDNVNLLVHWIRMWQQYTSRP